VEIQRGANVFDMQRTCGIIDWCGFFGILFDSWNGTRVYQAEGKAVNTVTLYVIDGPAKGTNFTLKEGITTLGRSLDNDIALSDIAASRYHAKFRTEADTVYVMDLRSSQGVFVDGERIAPGIEVELRDDSTIMIGTTLLSLQEEFLAKTASHLHLPRSLKSLADADDMTSRKNDTRNYIQSLELSLAVSHALVQSLNLNELLGEVMDQIFTLLKRIDRGAILMINEETGSLKEMVSKTRYEDKSGIFSKIAYSRSIVTRAVKQRKPVIMSDTSQVKKTDLSESMEQMNIRSVMCVPLIYKGEVKGVIYVDSIGRPEGFRRDDLQLLTGLGNTASVAIENARLHTDLENLVTQRTKQLNYANEQLQASESRFRALFEHMSSGVVILEASDGGNDFLVKGVNKAAETMDRIKNDDVINKSALAVFPIFKDSDLFSMLKRVWKTGASEDHSPMRYQDASTVSWRKHSAYKLPNGEIVFIYQDLTEQMQAIENQQSLQKQLAHAQKMESLGRLAGGVAHNFRNILQAIMGNSQFLQMAYSHDKQVQEVAGNVNESVRKGSEFIDSLLTFSRRDGEQGKLVIDLRDVLEEIHRITSNTFDKRIRITTHIEDPLPVKGDFSSLSQAFMNICNNSRDAMPEGGNLTIEAARVKEMAVVTISDTGCGIETKEVKRIFDPFYTTKEVGEGTGLGLSITHGIIEEHDASVSVTSQPGKGTVFTVSIPIAQEYDRIDSKSSQRLRRGKGEKILIVDDEPNVLHGLENMLKTIGYELDAVASGIEAIEHYKMFQPDLVLMDWKMPHMDGQTCAQKILEHNPHARIVMISGYHTMDREVPEAERQKAIRDYIVKPCDLTELSRVVAKALRS
jgi:nitrogen-specific signal transduction histidine kinase